MYKSKWNAQTHLNRFQRRSRSLLDGASSILWVLNLCAFLMLHLLYYWLWICTEFANIHAQTKRRAPQRKQSVKSWITFARFMSLTYKKHQLKIFIQFNHFVVIIILNCECWLHFEMAQGTFKLRMKITKTLLMVLFICTVFPFPLNFPFVSFSSFFPPRKWQWYEFGRAWNFYIQSMFIHFE